MTDLSPLHAKLNAQMLIEFRDDAEDRMNAMQYRLDRLADNPCCERDCFIKLQALAFGFVGTGRSYGFPIVSAIANRMADYLRRSAERQEIIVAEAQQFVDAIARVVEIGRNPKEDEATLILRSLPVFSNFEVSSVEVREASILLVSSARVVSVMVSDELYNCGYKATIIDNPFEAMALACQMKPDCIITASQLEGLNGIDLCRALHAIEPTRGIPLGLLTSFEKGASELKGLPDDVDVIGLGASLSEDLAEFLSQMRLA